MKHPAKFTKSIMSVLADLLRIHNLVLDPFAGTGRIHEIGREAGVDTVGVEIEPEWAYMNPKTILGNSLYLPFPDNTFDAICTSPVYGNRLSDHHNAKDGSVRRSYTHDLGRQLHEDNAGKLPFGEKYKQFHELVWRETIRVLQPDGYFYLNVSDFIKNGKQIFVTDWHKECLSSLGLILYKTIVVPTPRLRYGSNSNFRIEGENVLILIKAH